MIKNHIKTAWRYLYRHRTNAFINTLGLCCAFIFTVLIAAFIWHEARVDASIKDVERQYLIQSDITGITTSGMLARTLQEEYPDLVESYFRFDGISAILSREGQSIQQSAIIADSTFFSMFGFGLASGDERTALSDPTQIVLTHESAIALFGTIDAVGEQVEVANFAGEQHPFTVSGVLQPFAQNSVTHLIADDPAQVILPVNSASYFGRQIDSWSNPYIASFVTLSPGITPQQLDAPISRLFEKHLPENQLKSMNTQLVPLSGYHLNKGDGTIKRMLYTLGIVGSFILLMACINFVNISINTAARRLKEIGVRKVIGSSSAHLRIQFLAESLLLVAAASLIAMVCYPLFSGVAEGIFGKTLPTFGELGFTFWIVTWVAFLVIGLVAGIYPAFRLSSYRTIQSLKGRLPSSLERTLVLRGLVGVQLSIALFVLIATTVIISQMSVFFGADLGYDKSHLITAQVPRDWSPEGTEQMSRIRERLIRLPEVESITLSYDVPGAMSSGSAQLKGSISAESAIATHMIFADRHFADTYKVPLLAGAFFSDGESAESLDRVVINETLAQAMGYQHPADALNQPVYFEGSEAPLVISGVSRDFYGNTMHTPVGATIWFNVASSNSYRYFTIRLGPGDLADSLQRLERAWKQAMPNAPFDYSFVDDRLKTLYQTELRLQQAGTASAILAVVIVLLGLVGLISQDLVRRTKEIGIRKVLGASVRQVVMLFMKDISGVFLIATVVAVPLAYILMHRWLETYYLKATLDTAKLGLPVVVLAGLTGLVIIVQTIRTAIANPVESLRDE